MTDARRRGRAQVIYCNRPRASCRTCWRNADGAASMSRFFALFWVRRNQHRRHALRWTLFVEHAEAPRDLLIGLEHVAEIVEKAAVLGVFAGVLVIGMLRNLFPATEQGVPGLPRSAAYDIVVLHVAPSDVARLDVASIDDRHGDALLGLDFGSGQL